MTIIYTPGITLEMAEKLLIQGAMKFHQGRKTAVASALGCAIRTLDTKLEKYAEEDVELERRQEQQRIRDKEFLDRSRGITGVHVESTPRLSTQQPMPMQKRQEVQEMPSRHSAKSGHGRRG